MTSSRRTRWSFACDRAVELAHELGKPVLILEALRLDYPWASPRLHRFVIDGMRDNAASLEDTPVGYYPYVEPDEHAGKGLLEALARDAAVVVTDSFPTFFLPRMLEAAGRKLDVRLEAIDGNGLVPLSLSRRTFPTAYVFRRFLQQQLPNAISFPSPDPFHTAALKPFTYIDDEITTRWPRASGALLSGNDEAMRALPLPGDVPSAPLRGGSQQADAFLKRFLRDRLARYEDERSIPDANADSQLSPFLHFGHISVHQVFSEVYESLGAPMHIEPKPATGKRAGFWGLPSYAESFLDELITWRECGYHVAANDPTFGTYEAIPPWARQSLERHMADPRARLFSVEELALAQSNDEVWNAAQMQLRREGRIHNAVRMIWGKKVLEWTRSPEEAFSYLVELNNRFALDGRNPNSYSGISWCLGKFDRPWGPERPIFGVVRYMTTESAKRKYKLKAYIARYSPESLL